MVVSANPPLQEVVARLMDIERRMDRLAAARILSPPIGNADVAANAGIVVSKLNAGGTANRALGSNGTTASWQQLTEHFLTQGSIHNYQVKNISTGPYFASGGMDPLVFIGGNPSLTTSASTYAVVVAGMIRCHTNTATHTGGNLLLNGGNVGEMGYWTPPLSTYMTISGYLIIPIGGSTTYSGGMAMSCAAGVLVTLDVGYCMIIELKR